MVTATVSRVGELFHVCGRAALAIAATAFAVVASAQAEPIRGAGSTFAAPVIAKWARLYKDARADGGDYFTLDWTVDYEPVGSLAGVMRLQQPEMDFAATDVPVPPAELAKAGREQFPIVMGGVAVIANLDGVTAGSLRLTGPLLADIFLGKVKSWSDPAIKVLNPDLSLPDLEISVVHRKDGSGSTFVFTTYLSAVSEAWKAAHGADTLITWPTGSGAEGTRALIQAVQAKQGAISYAEYGQVERAGVPYAAIANKAGAFVKPDPAGVQAVAGGVDWSKAEQFAASLVDQPGEAAYPISTATFAVVPVAERSAGRFVRVHDFFRLAFEQGGKDATALGYVPLPADLVRLIEQRWADGMQAGN